MKLAFGRAGRALPGLDLRMAAFGMERGTVAGLVGLAPDGALVARLVRGPGGTGALIVDPVVRSAIIEAETMGRIGKAAPEARPPTRIDALMTGAFFDAALSRLDDGVEGLSISASLIGWRVGDLVAGAALLPLMIDEVPMRLFRLGFDFGDGARSGSAILALPMEVPKPAASGSQAEDFTQAVGSRVLNTQAEVHAILARLSLPLDKVSDWEAGTVVPLPRQALGQVCLEDIDGNSLARGRLGQMNGNRAVRILSISQQQG